MGLRPTGCKLFVDGYDVSNRLLSNELDFSAGTHEYTLDGGARPVRVLNGVREDKGNLHFLYDPEAVPFEAGDEVESLYLYGPDVGAPTARLPQHGFWQTTHSHPMGGLQEIVTPIGGGFDAGWQRL